MNLQIEQNVRKKVLWPLGIAIVGSLAIFLFVSNYYMELGLARTQEKRLQTLTSRYHGYIVERTGLMRSVLQQLRRDPAIIQALDRRDRTFLLQHSTPLFKELLSEQHITHFYYHTPDGTNLLRVHKPSRHGDRIDRITLREAQRSNTISDGLELGPLGTFTLRVVLPILDRKRVVGYLELGEDIDPVLDHLATEVNAEMAVLIQKRFLIQNSWLIGREMLGDSVAWDLLPDHVVGGLSDPVVLDHLPKLATPDALAGDKTIEAVLEEKKYRGRFLNLMDAGGRSVGSLLVLQDVNDTLQNYRTSVVLISSFCFLLATFLFWIAATILGRTDRNLKLINEQLAEDLYEPGEARPTLKKMPDSQDDHMT